MEDDDDEEEEEEAEEEEEEEEGETVEEQWEYSKPGDMLAVPWQSGQNRDSQSHCGVHTF